MTLPTASRLWGSWGTPAKRPWSGCCPRAVSSRGTLSEYAPMVFLLVWLIPVAVSVQMPKKKKKQIRKKGDNLTPGCTGHLQRPTRSCFNRCLGDAVLTDIKCQLHSTLCPFRQAVKHMWAELEYTSLLIEIRIKIFSLHNQMGMTLFQLIQNDSSLQAHGVT